MTSTPFTYTPPAVFRGARDYVHSTDMYEEIVTGAALAGMNFDGPIDLRIRQKTNCQLAYVFHQDALMRGNEVATCNFIDSGQPCVVSILNTNEPVALRKDYDESVVARKAVFAGSTVRIEASTGLRPIESITALAVHLHKTILPPKVGQRWMLGQLSISRPLADSEAEFLKLAIDRNIGSSITRTSIHARDGILGFMTFVLSDG